MKPIKAPQAVRRVLYVISIIMAVYSCIDLNFKWSNMGHFCAALCACVIMDIMLVDIGGIGTIDFMDAVVAFLFFLYGYNVAVFFVLLINLIFFCVNGKFGSIKRKREDMLFNAAMTVIVTFTTSMVFNNIWRGIDNVTIVETYIISAGYIVFSLIINFTIFMVYKRACKGKWFYIPKEYWKQTIINCLISTMTTIILLRVDANYNLFGAIAVLVTLTTISYWISANNKLEVRNNVMKGIIKITKDIVIYGDFGEKCKYLTINLKNLIPYSVCAIYSFNNDNKIYENDQISYPIAFYKPDGMDIGDLGLTLSLRGNMDNQNEDIYVTSAPSRDLAGQFSYEILSKIESAIMVPVVIEKKLLGMIFIGGDDRLVRFIIYGVEDMLNILSSQMALAMENNNIYNSIKDSADIDPLTRLYNRNAFKREIQELISTNTTFSLVLYDIDDFKKVNDTYGHLVGDEVLKLISERIKKSIRKTDVACRYGGEEIVIIFRDLNKEDSVVISDRIRRRVEETRLNWYDRIIGTTISGGIASYPEDGDTVEDIIRKADEALYGECKQKGKNRVFAYNNELSRTVDM